MTPYKEDLKHDMTYEEAFNRVAEACKADEQSAKAFQAYIMHVNDYLRSRACLPEYGLNKS